MPKCEKYHAKWKANMAKCTVANTRQMVPGKKAKKKSKTWGQQKLQKLFYTWIFARFQRKASSTCHWSWNFVRQRYGTEKAVKAVKAVKAMPLGGVTIVTPSWRHRVTHKQHSSCVQLRWGHRKEVPTWSSVSRFSKPSKRALRRLGNIGSQEVKNGERRRKWAESLGEIPRNPDKMQKPVLCASTSLFRLLSFSRICSLSSQDVVFRCFP